jgi:hypothetical protein
MDTLLMKEAGVDVLVSMLPASEEAELGLGDAKAAPPQGRLLRKHPRTGRFIALPSW